MIKENNNGSRAGNREEVKREQGNEAELEKSKEMVKREQRRTGARQWREATMERKHVGYNFRSLKG